MRVYMQVIGTRGDLEIFLFLGNELQRRGHEVVIGTSTFYAARVEGSGLLWDQLGDGSFSELTSILESLQSETDQRSRVYRYVEQWLRPQLSSGNKSIKAQLSIADYSINNLKMVWKRNGAIFPGATIVYDPPSSPGRAGSYAPQRIAHDGALLDVVAMSKSLVDPDNEWPPGYQFTGFWFGKNNPPNVSQAIEDFVTDGEPPVVLTMGSMVMIDAVELCIKFQSALKDLGRRGVVIGGWSNLGANVLNNDVVISADDIPYQWLFERAGAVIHHGGCGTVAAVLRAGIPSILLPRIISQENFADILSRQGVSAATLDADQMSVNEFAGAIDFALKDNALRENASLWAERIMADGGVARAAELIEEHARTRTVRLD